MFLIKMQFPLPIWSHLKTLLIVIVLSVAYGQDRKITAKLNPGCTSCPSDTVLVYAKCDGSADTIHQIWDFTRHIPTVIVTVASLNSTLNITWNGSHPIHFALSEKPKYSFATAIDKLYEYNDLDDNGHIDPKFPQKEYWLNRIVWQLNDSKLTDNEVMVNLYGFIKEDCCLQGTIHIKLDLMSFKDYATDLPHLIHTANSTLFDISLENLTSSREYNASRFSLHMLVLSTDHVTDNMHYTVRKSLDDEHTPAVFEVIEIKTPSLFSSGEGGYLQFRPVGYTQPKRGFASSTTASVSDLHRTFIPRRSTLKYFYEDFDEDNLLIEDMFISFGESGDGFYKQHNYTSWSFSAGYGTPPIEKFSFFVIMVISVGLGVPVLLALSGVVYVVRRRYRQRIDRTRFTNED